MVLISSAFVFRFSVILSYYSFISSVNLSDCSLKVFVRLLKAVSIAKLSCSDFLVSYSSRLSTRADSATNFLSKSSTRFDSLTSCKSRLSTRFSTFAVAPDKAVSTLASLAARSETCFWAPTTEPVSLSTTSVYDFKVSTLP